jgi:hypothetical protein
MIETAKVIDGLKIFIVANAKFAELESLVNKVNIFYDHFEIYARHRGLERDTLENFAYDVVRSGPDSVKGLLQQIQGIIFDRGLLKLVADNAKVN